MQTKTLREVIRDEIISRGGILPFVNFMDLALYCPNLGYYETKKDRVGRKGDFYTSVSTGSLFGQLLAFQFAEWLEELKSSVAKLKIIEAGAHDGQLARDILTWLQSSRPGLFERLEYVIIEPSASRQPWQRETLKSFEGIIQWHSNFDRLERADGIIFANELLDAFPVRRFSWDTAQRKWFEWGVAAENDKFIWAKIPNHDGGLPVPELPVALLEVLPDGYAIETCTEAQNWWRAAANCLDRGKLLTIDYGYTDDERFLPSRKNGTLRAFFQHHFADDVLANPGEQDLTAHVNFSDIQKTGEQNGLPTDAFSTQSKFLTQILEKTVKDKSFGEWTPARTRQFQTLTHPEHLGRAFRVLAQSR